MSLDIFMNILNLVHKNSLVGINWYMKFFTIIKSSSLNDFILFAKTK